MKFLVTGGGGFLGSVLVPHLLERGHVVRILDSGVFGLDHLPADIELVQGSLESLTTEDSERLTDGVECVVHLAAISNDPSADLDPEVTRSVNTYSTQRLAQASRSVGARFVFASTASIYGDSGVLADEDAETHPLSHYARSKADAEDALLELRTDTWAPTILRMGTLFGLSPRMRFDLVVNIFGMRMALDRRLTVFGDGMQWRPYIHVDDAARGLMHFAERDPLVTPEVIFNVSHQNLRVVDLVDAAVALDPDLEVEFVESEPDTRTYLLATDRARAAGFESHHDVTHGLREVRDAILSGQVQEPSSSIYRNAAWLRDR